MFVGVLLGIGWIVVLLGAALHLRHLISVILKKFEGCTSASEAFGRALRLDDVTLLGIAMSVVLALSLIATVIGELAGFNPRF